MEYEVMHNEKERRFEMTDHGDLALVEYQLLGDGIMNIYHTEVPESIEGKGVGSAMMKEALEFARRNHYRVVPTCAFAQSYLQKHPDYMDVLK